MYFYIDKETIKVLIMFVEYMYGDMNIEKLHNFAKLQDPSLLLIIYIEMGHFL